jgi:molybdopterin-containing oxidoreductase family iron-sulfur binding subunit
MSEHDHFSEQGQGDVELNRRTFLKLAGFALSGAVAGGCRRAPVQNAVPFLVQSPEVIPGRSLVYASTCGACNAGCGMLVKNRDGRPIKLEGNPSHPLSLGGLCAAGQASLLGLYDSKRLAHPLKNGQRASWETVDGEIRARLDEARRHPAPGRAIRFLSSTITSPTTRRAISRFLGDFPNARHVIHDPLSCSAILDAHQQTHGIRALPRYFPERADIIVSFDADLLGTWIAPVQFAAGYQAGRYLQGPVPHLSYHVQVESRLSLTGSKADQRVCIAPGEAGLVMTQLAGRLARRTGEQIGTNWQTVLEESEASSVPTRFLDDLADRLWNLRGRPGSSSRCLLLCGSQDLAQQLLCNFLNQLLNNYGSTLDVANPSYQNQSDDRAYQQLLEEIRQGQVHVLFVYRTNPLYDAPAGPTLRQRLRDIPLLIGFNGCLDETAAQAQYVCPEPHYLETWNDAQPVEEVVSLYQPVIERLGDTRSLLETLANWKGIPQSAYDQLRETWQAEIYPRRLITVSFNDFWNQALHDGSVRLSPRPPVRFRRQAPVPPIRQARRAPEGTTTLVLYAKVSMPNGSHAYNPWLQELPDPISKITWDNYACLSPATAARLDVGDGDEVRLEGVDNVTLTLPVLVQKGQHDQVVAVALGYGSKLSERFAEIGPPWLEARPTVGGSGLVGVNAAPLLTFRENTVQYVRDGVRLVKTGRQLPLACTQQEESLRVPLPIAGGPPAPPIIRETNLPALAMVQTRPAEQRGHLWPDDHDNSGPRWGMAIDLNACTGCSACVVACQVENNIPVVGKDEVRRHREMHWLRIDRYYSSPATSPLDAGPRREAEVDVAHQPMLCQHCGNAPCEVVCPVLATVHSAEGLNQQVYNRCVGTRYCANNCPYKVRRFNWFDYAHDDLMENLVLNPDVTVRSRGVMEKCTFCVQRIQAAKIEARRLGLPVSDGDIQTACQQSCPTRAIVFGDLRDQRSRAAQLASSARAYRVLEELNVQPAVSYLTLVRNRPAGQGQTRT